MRQKTRPGVPAWVWFLVGLLVLLAALALIDYFVTNLVLNRPAAAEPGTPRTNDPFSEVVLTGNVIHARLSETLLIFKS